jgi:hypothetical protein
VQPPAKPASGVRTAAGPSGQSGKSAVMQPAKKASGPRPAVQLAGRPPSGRAPSSSSGRQDTADREAFGLTALKPSEMIAGLDAVADRAEKLEAREEAKRKAGGKMINMAVHVDETGSRWKRNVIIGICLTVAAVVIGGGLMMYFSNRTVRDPRELRAETYLMMSELSARAAGLRASGEGDRLSADSARDFLQKQIEAEYQSTLKAIETDRKNNSKYTIPNAQLRKQCDFLEKMRTLKDSWGDPLVFEIESETLKISSKRGKTSTGEPLSATVPLSGGTTPKKKDAR